MPKNPGRYLFMVSGLRPSLKILAMSESPSGVPKARMPRLNQKTPDPGSKVNPTMKRNITEGAIRLLLRLSMIFHFETTDKGLDMVE